MIESPHFHFGSAVFSWRKILKKSQFLICSSAAVLTAVLMVMTAEIVGEKEIIFPEIAALALGAFVCPKMPRKVTPLTVGVLLSVTAAVILLSAMKKLFPPVAALAVLQFIIPENLIMLYPLEVGTGVAAFTAVSMLYGKIAYRKIQQ